MAGIRVENGVVVGTSGDKYQSANPVARYLVRQFDRAIVELSALAAPGWVLEVGAGEGHVTRLMLDATNAQILATDISATVLSEAERNLSSARVSYRAIDIASLEPIQPVPDLVACCEVLEHLPDPARAMKVLRAQGAKWYLFSVPREPIWRLLNVGRGAYLQDFGNSPGHLQHWSKRQFLRFVGQFFEPILVRSPLPWTVVLCRP